MAVNTGSVSLTGGGPTGVRRLLVLIAVLLPMCGARALAAHHADTTVAVEERGGQYHVVASFTVAQPAAAVMAVLTDYDRIPRFMPDVRTSHVLERGEGEVVIEQEAVARFMMFSKRIHLVLEVREGLRSLFFRDRSASSFTRYEGGWTLTEQAGRTHVRYELTAHPSFEVPEFLLKRLLKRDSLQMIERLRAEIATRR